MKKVNSNSHFPDMKVTGYGKNFGGKTEYIEEGERIKEETVEDWSCHEDCPIKIMDEQSGETRSSGQGGHTGLTFHGQEYKKNGNENKYPQDKGGASRFFYTAKASKSERNFGLEEFKEKRASAYGYDLGLGNAGEGMFKDRNTTKTNIHPTVKPVKLMQYLIRLITPPNGKVLDPFNGSGTTGIACCLEQFNYTGIELSEEYCNISRARITAWNEIEEYEDYKKIIENQDDEEDEQNKYGVQGTLF